MRKTRARFHWMKHTTVPVAITLAVLCVGGMSPPLAHAQGEQDAPEVVQQPVPQMAILSERGQLPDKICINGRPCEEMAVMNQQTSPALTLCEVLLPTKLCTALEGIQIGQGSVAFTLQNATYQVSNSGGSLTLGGSITKSSNGTSTIFSLSLTATPPGYLLGAGGQSTVSITNTSLSTGTSVVTRVWGTNNANLLKLTTTQTVNGRVVAQQNQTVSKVQGAVPTDCGRSSGRFGMAFVDSRQPSEPN